MDEADGTSYEGQHSAQPTNGGRCKTHMKRSALSASIVALGLAVGLTGGWLATGQAQPKPAPSPAVTAPPPRAAAEKGSVAELAAALKTAVGHGSTPRKGTG